MPGISFDEFKKTTKKLIDEHYVEVKHLISKGIMSAGEEAIFLFPSTLLYTKTETHYVFELIGAMRKLDPLQVKDRNATSLNQVVNNFSPKSDSFYVLGTEGAQPTNMHLNWKGQNLLGAFPDGSLAARFPGVTVFDALPNLVSFSVVPSLLAIDAERIRSIALDNCMLTSRVEEVIRPKFVNFLYAVSIDADAAEIAADLAVLKPVPGKLVPGIQAAALGKAEAARTAAGFATLYLQGVRETTITAFLEKHSEVIERVFDADKVFYQPELAWREGNPDPTEESIQPDVLLRTRGGEWKIVEFKLPLLDKKSLTAGNHARRRFTLSVADGVHQLANYEEYFGFSKNLMAAQELLGEAPTIPSLCLVVGSDENFDGEEVRQATRLHRPFDIIDYDTLMRLYLAASV
ncbi:Shedu anti-phage system protein SduA domain-containing protein [Streptacidiphilus albus]|uniref:Shedu anti-phage system protein SduA domain-containing protein n=1 Tax=Streptacidiphilus albus TaxID=105425 RepID=UPI00054B6725|nr:Shedu anti-phage system protein SduA domain-containing protein [Streptacidiphilus albus]